MVKNIKKMDSGDRQPKLPQIKYNDKDDESRYKILLWDLEHSPKLQLKGNKLEEYLRLKKKFGGKL